MATRLSLTAGPPPGTMCMMQSRRRSRVPLGTLTAAAMLLCAQPALLQAAEPSCPMRPVSTEHRVAWASPLDRVVSVRLTEVTVREALDRLARLAKIGLTYSNELLPEEGACASRSTRCRWDRRLNCCCPARGCGPLPWAMRRSSSHPCRIGHLRLNH